MECPWGCGWKGDPSEYLKHLETCPKHPDAQKPPSQDEKVHKFLEKVAAEEVVEGPAETPVEEEKLAPKIFKTEEEFRSWLEKHGITAEPRPMTGLFKDDKRVGSYFETAEGIQVDLAEDAKTWLIRDEVFVEVEAGEEMMVEKPIETPVEETGEETPEA